jgi:peptidoglycan hydrolase-like protein with peptidoglycan-binding domain
VASGTVFLNPSLKSDAKIIQKRLADLGYYNMEVDGLFGKGSQRAVQSFKKDNGLGDNATWDIRTQKTLFKGTDF